MVYLYQFRFPIANSITLIERSHRSDPIGANSEKRNINLYTSITWPTVVVVIGREKKGYWHLHPFSFFFWIVHKTICAWLCHNSFGFFHLVHRHIKRDACTSRKQIKCLCFMSFEWTIFVQLPWNIISILVVSEIIQSYVHRQWREWEGGRWQSKIEYSKVKKWAAGKSERECEWFC